METTGQRAARIAALREAWLAGTLDLAIDADDPGLDRLLDALFAPGEVGRSRR